ncbi:uncharacterized protein LOC114260456 [Camellia sinensis]|uniref:DC1 domain-containing protein n=1 Tax=Camellia sinensis var. sinensis TaxID=542762 RepID=A0A4S4ETH4_CAMSN|nr:uncharacterized protein LOC114260456 [Camellia sinensis]THG20191.1 hypothetical protein TEA_005576 [Camellia sinensis var. sinensis]
MRKTKSMSKHFLHMHELELNDKGEDCKDNCSICKQPISESNFYHCNLCPEKIRIHEYSCSEIPLQLDHHPIHPLHIFFLSEKVRRTNFCHACGGNCYGGFAYKCVDSAFILDVNCALLTKNNNNKQQYHQQKKKIQFQFQQPQLPNHPHPLILCYKDKNLTYKCTCCSLTIDGDCLYVCLQCKGLLHHSCAEMPWKIEHPFHSSHSLFLQSRSGFYDREFICSLCCQRRDGFAYHCHKCKFVVDVHCACLKPARQTQIQQFTHFHPLVLCHNKDNLPYTCYACLLPLEDSIYFCPECGVLLHKKCANLPQESSNTSFTLSTLFPSTTID